MSQQLFIVIGGELVDLQGVEFRNPESLHLVGVFPGREDAVKAWRSNAQRTVDNALMRYFVLPLHEQLQYLTPALSAAEFSRQWLAKHEPLEPLDGLDLDVGC